MARASGRVAIFHGQYARIQGVEALQQLIAGLPDGVVATIQPALKLGAEQLAAKVKVAAPVAEEFEAHPGQLRDSVHVEDGRHDLSQSVVVDARDAEGRYYPAHVEYGHRTPEGGHVNAKPFFWPAYHVTKKAIKARISRAVGLAVKAVSAAG